jgi:hypothetical protein
MEHQQLLLHASGSKVCRFALRKGRGRMEGAFFPLFPMCVFPSGSPSSQLVPQDKFWIAPQFYPIWFAQSLTVSCINWKGGPYEANLFLFCDWRSKEVLLLWSAQCSLKKWWCANQYGSLKKNGNRSSIVSNGFDVAWVFIATRFLSTQLHAISRT